MEAMHAMKRAEGHLTISVKRAQLREVCFKRYTPRIAIDWYVTS